MMDNLKNSDLTVNFRISLITTNKLII